MTTYLFRRLPKSFSRRAKGHPEINVAKATQQYENFRRIVTGAAATNGGQFVVFPEAEHFPDSCFIQDTCISLCTGIAVATVPRAPSRQGESGLLRAFLESCEMNGELDHVYRLSEKCDGGDVLCIGKNVFVAGTRRTSIAAHARWKQICARHDMTCTVVPIEQELHLKSVCTWLNKDIGLVASRTADGYRAAEIITSKLDVDMQSVHFMCRGANMLRIDRTVIHQPGLFLRALRRRHPELEFVECDMSELNKAGGALTCSVVALKTVA